MIMMQDKSIIENKNIKAKWVVNPDKSMYLHDRTTTRKVGKTMFTVSSFLKSDSPITYLEIVKRLIESELKRQ